MRFKRLAGNAVAERHFGRMLGAAVALGAAIRLAYVLTDDRWLIGGDAFTYHHEALRLADGLGYTSSFGDVGAPMAHHPPGWLTLLGLVSWLGRRSLLTHQLVGVAIGLGVVVLAGFVGRRYFSARVGVVAALIAALYPISRDTALRNISDNLDKLPVVVPARFGRMLAVFRPTQTVAFTAEWMTTDHRPIWAWVAPFWLLVPLAIVGALTARRSGRFLPRLGPLLIVGALVAVAYGEPRYHTPADLGIVVLAGVGVERLLTRRSRRSVEVASRPRRLPSVYVPS